MRNASKSKFLLCFRPVDDIDAMLESRAAVDRSASCRFACIPVADKHETKNSKTKSMFLDQGCPKFAENWIVPQPSKRTLSQNRRARNKSSYSQNCFGSKRSYSTYTESSSTGDEKSMLSLSSVDTNIQEIKTLESSLSSSSLSPAVSESKNLSKYCSTKENQKESSDRDELEKQKKFESSGIYLLLISLALTVLLGKFYGIILTSIWLCLFSLRDASYRRGCKVVEHKIRSSTENTRIGTITEGLAERNYHNGH